MRLKAIELRINKDASKIDKVLATKLYGMEEENISFKIRGGVPPILVEDRVVVELKTVELLAKRAEVLDYLKAIGERGGLLVNITRPKAEFRRLVL